MLPDKDNSTPPEWLQKFDRRLQQRMQREQDPFKSNNFTTRMMYVMMFLLSLTAWVLIPLHALYTRNIYLIAFLLLGIGIWTGLAYHQRKQKRTIWHFFPVSFREYLQKRSLFFQGTWHLIFITLVAGTFIMISRFIGLEDILLPRHVTPPSSVDALTPEQKAVYETLQKIKGNGFPQSPPAATAPSASTTTPAAPATPATPSIPSDATPAPQPSKP